MIFAKTKLVLVKQMVFFNELYQIYHAVIYMSLSNNWEKNGRIANVCDC